MRADSCYWERRAVVRLCPPLAQLILLAACCAAAVVSPDVASLASKGNVEAKFLAEAHTPKVQEWLVKHYRRAHPIASAAQGRAAMAKLTHVLCNCMPLLSRAKLLATAINS
jgi:hypothetical protein